MVQEPIENGGSEGAVVVEYLGPLFKRAIGCDDDRSLLVAKADDLEEKIGAMLVNGQEPEFVTNEQ